jgi:hypothetical protein
VVNSFSKCPSRKYDHINIKQKVTFYLFLLIMSRPCSFEEKKSNSLRCRHISLLFIVPLNLFGFVCASVRPCFRLLSQCFTPEKVRQICFNREFSVFLFPSIFISKLKAIEKYQTALTTRKTYYFLCVHEMAKAEVFFLIMRIYYYDKSHTCFVVYAIQSIHCFNSAKSYVQRSQCKGRVTECNVAFYKYTCYLHIREPLSV